MRDEKVFQRRAGRFPLHLIIRSTIMVLDGSWRLQREKPANASAQTGILPGYDYLFTINGHNHLIYPGDLPLIHNIEKDPAHAALTGMNVRLISSDGTIHEISFSGRFYIPPAPAITRPLAVQAQKQYEDLFQSIDQGFAILQLIYHDDAIAKDCLIITTNRAFEKMTACKNTAGKRLKELIPSARAAWLHSLSMVIENDKANRFTVLVPELAGGWYDIYAFPTGSRDERKVAILFNDITERLRSAEVLRDKQLKLEIAQGAGRVGIWTYDPVTREGMATKELIELTGYGGASETWNLEHFLALLHDEDKAAVKAAFEQARENNGIEVECRIMHRDRGLKWFLIRGSYFPAEGDRDSIMGSLIDITEQKVLEEQKDEFIAIASHELKTPVTSIKAYAEILLDFLRSKRDSARASMMERMVNQADRLTRLINDLLDTSKITSGQLLLDPEEFDLNDLIQERVEEIQRSTKHIFDISFGKIPPVIADKDRISQVINNLLANAIKYSPQRSRISITSGTTGSTVTISVRDEGIGLTGAAQQRVFERFYRANESAHFNIPGLGLGLYIAHEIIRKHHGTMRVISKPGEGSEFFFQLPIGSWQDAASQNGDSEKSSPTDSM